MAETKAGAQATPNGAGKQDDAAAAGAAADKGGKDTPAGAQSKPAGTETGQGAQGAASESGKPAAGAAAPAKVPDKYELKVPTGDEVFVTDRLLAHVATVARASGWSNEDAQAALVEHLGNVKAERAEMLVETKADPEYGGDRLVETERLVKLAIDRLRPANHPRREKFLAVLNRSSALQQIEIVAALADLGKQVAEDVPASGSGAKGSQKAPEDRMYKPVPASS